MGFLGTSRLIVGVVATLCAAILQTGCGGGGSEPSSEALQSRMRALTASNSAENEAPDLPAYLSPQVLGLTKVAERRVSRTVFDYDFVVQLKNGSRALSNLQAVITGSGAGTTVLAASAHVGELAADATATSGGKVTIRHDRALPFSPTAITWAFKGIVTASRDPIVVRRADPAMIRTLSDGQKVVMSQLMVVTDGTLSLEQDLAMFARLGAEVVGRVPEGNLYQLQIPLAMDEAALVAMRDRLGNEGHVVSVAFNGVAALTADSIDYSPNDAFIESQAEVLGMSNVTVAWNTIKNHFSYPGNQNGKPALDEPVVGVIDGGFTTALTDLKFKDLRGPEGGNDWGFTEGATGGKRIHGMHVAGIIGAIGNNGLDRANRRSQVAGIAWQANPKLYAGKSDGSLAVEAAQIGWLARVGARVINISMGYDEPADLTAQARTKASFLKNAFRYYDFLLVLSAGNSFNDTIKHQALANIFQSPGWDRYEEVRQRVLIVANADTSDPASPRLADRNAWTVASKNLLLPAKEDLWCNGCGPTNYGVGVEIAAPGTSILSLSDEENPDTARPNDTLRVQSGSSMAAPMVAGVAATILSINPKLSAPQIKKLIVDNSPISLRFNLPQFTIDPLLTDIWALKEFDKISHPIVDMQRVVVAALKEKGGQYIRPEVTTTSVSVSVLCQWPADNSVVREFESNFLSANLRIGAKGGNPQVWLQQVWAQPVSTFVLEPGKYSLQIQSAGMLGEHGQPAGLRTAST